MQLVLTTLCTVLLVYSSWLSTRAESDKTAHHTPPTSPITVPPAYAKDSGVETLNSCYWNEQTFVLDEGEMVALTSPSFGFMNTTSGYYYIYCTCTVVTGEDQVLMYWMDHMYGGQYLHNAYVQDGDRTVYYGGTDTVGVREISLGSSIRHSLDLEYYRSLEYKILVKAISKELASLPVGSSPCSGEAAVDITVDEHSWTKLYSPGWVTDDAMPAVPRDVYCLWKLRAPPGMIAEVSVDYFDLTVDDGYSCQDRLEVRVASDGLAAEGVELYCSRYDSGFVFEGLVFSEAVFILQTSPTNSSTGFNLNVRAKEVDFPYCGTSDREPVYVYVYQDFKSYNQSNGNYYNYQCETWILESDNYTQVYARFIYVDMESGSYDANGTYGCHNDVISTYTLWEDGSRTLIREMCGYYSGQYVYSETNRMVVEFRSNAARTDRGFSAYVRSRLPPPPTTPRPVVPRCTGEPAELTTGDTIQSYWYPNNYFNFQCEEWIVTVEEGFLATISFSAFYTESCCDRLRAYSESANGYRDQIGSYSGRNTPFIISTTNRMYLDFRADYSVTYSGFSGTVSASSPDELPGCHYVREVTEGDEFRSYNFPNNYIFDMCQNWVITVDEDRLATVEFDWFHVGYGQRGHCSNDKVVIYSGSSNNGTVLAELCEDLGRGRIIQSDTNQLYIEITTSDYGSYIGFNATAGSQSSELLYRCVEEPLLDLSANDELEATAGHDFSAPDSYRPQYFCQNWLLSVSDDSLAALDVSNHSLSIASNCLSQVLEAYTVQEDELVLINRYCDTRENIKLTSNTSQMLIKFSGYTYPYTSANFTATTVEVTPGDIYDCGGFQTFANEGTIELPVDPETEQYYANSRCLYMVTAPEDMIIEFNITVDIEDSADCNYDALLLLTSDSSADQITRLCGQRETVTQYSLTNVTYLHFISDHSIEGQGFRVDFTTRSRDYLPWLRCGTPSVQPRIIGGRPATPDSIPWQVALVDSNDMDSFCGGSIIDRRTIVTAAHCVYYKSTRQFDVIVGIYDRYDELDVQLSHRMHVDRIIMHHRYVYDTSGSGYDIAVLHLEHDIVFSERASPICLPEAEPAPGGDCIVSGWGRLSYGGYQPSEMYVVEVPIVDRDTCNELMYGRVDETMICTGRETGGIGTCHGDSGGPVVCYSSYTSRWSLVGVVSWGRICARSNPSVDANVHYLLDFITDNLYY